MGAFDQSARGRGRPRSSRQIWSHGDLAVELPLATARPEDRDQFERLGYFALDAKDTSPAKPVFNRTITRSEAIGVRRSKPSLATKSPNGQSGFK